MQRAKLYDLSPLTMGDLFYLHKSIKIVLIENCFRSYLIYRGPFLPPIVA